MNEPQERLEVVNESGEIIGLAARSVIHRNPALLHRVVHVLIFDGEGRLLLQRRSMNKDIAPGAWDSSVGGHVGVGEDPVLAAAREMEEELGIRDCELTYLHTYLHTEPFETELVTTYHCTYMGDIKNFNREEIDEIRFWNMEEIRASLGAGLLSSHFEDEFGRYSESQTLRTSGP